MDEYEQRHMDPDERVLFREKVVSRAAFLVAVVFLAVFGLVGLALIGAGAAGIVPAALGVSIGAVSAAFGAMMGVLGAMFSVYRSMVTTSHVHVHFGWVKRRIAFSAIESVRAIRLQGFKQGKVSIGLDGIVRTWVGKSSSGRGVEITYQEPGARKHVITIGSEDADQYVATIERARAGATAASATPVRVAAAEDAAEAEERADEAGADARRSAR